MVAAPTFYVVPGSTVKGLIERDRNRVFEAVETAYRLHACGEALNPDSSFLRYPDKPSARIIALPAHLGGDVQKSGIKWISSFPENRAGNLARASAVLILNDAATGYPLACLEASLISATRTAASAALAAEHISPVPFAGALGIIGTGVIARTTVEWLLFRGWRFSRISLYDVDRSEAERFARWLRDEYGLEADIQGRLDEVVCPASLLLFTTTALDPYLSDARLLGHCPSILHLSLRDICVNLILASQNIVDDADHCLKARTSLHLSEMATGNRDFVAGSLVDVLDKKVTPDRGRPRIFSPFGLGVLDLAVGNFVLEAAVASGAAIALPGLLQQFCAMVNALHRRRAPAQVIPTASRRSVAHMSRVWSCNEWDQLEEVIVGNPLGARFPTPDRSTQVAEFPDRSLAEIPRGPFPQRIIEETEEDLNEFVGILEGLGITVKRPQTWPHEAGFSTIHWQAEGYYNYCPRDVLLVIGDQIIETPNVIRSRAQETFSYRALLLDYMRSGAKWYGAPKPMLLDSLFEVDLAKPTPRDDEPAFDAANVLRFGRDLIYLVSATGNELGGHWLQTMLGDSFRVHFLKGVYYGSHIDSTLVALRPGLVLCNPARVNDDTVPEVLKQWQIIYSPPMENTGRFDSDYLSKCIGSDWIDMNAFSINPSLVVVDRNQTALIRLLEKHGLDVIPLRLRHSKMLGGGPHCVTLDIRRAGALERYFD